MRSRDDKTELSVTAGQAKATDPKSVEESGPADAPVVSLSRRGFLSRATVSTAVAAAAVSVPSLLSKRAKASQESDSPDIARVTQEAEVASEGAPPPSRRLRAFRIRIQAAEAEVRVPVPRQKSNGDEDRYPSRIGNFSKGLPHDDIGEVDPAAYDALLTAIASEDPDDFERIPIGGTVKLANPQAGLAFDLEGTDSGQLALPPAPALASAERAGEMVED